MSRPGRPRAASDAVKRKNLSKSVTEFFSKLCPSNRPERGGTARPTAEDSSEHQLEELTPLRPTAGCRRVRSRSLDRHEADTISANLWNTPSTLPRRAHSVGSTRRKPVATQMPPSVNSRHHRPVNPPPNLYPNPASNSNANRIPPHFPPRLPHRLPPSPPTRPPPPSSSNAPAHHRPPLHHNPPFPHNKPPPPNPPSTHHPPTFQTTFPHPPPPPTGATTHDLYLAKRALRQQRRTLISSGDFLGVTGVNPYTGEPDIITPPTSSDDAIITTTSSSSPTGSALAAAMFTQQQHQQQQQQQQRDAVGGVPGREGWREGEGEAELEMARKRDKDLRRVLREEERLSRAEQRKEQVREVLMQHGGGVRWRKEEGGWSSVAEPKLSPILQSPVGSGKSSGSVLLGEGVGPRGGGGGGGGGRLGEGVVIPERQESFLGMAAVAGKGDGCHRRGQKMGAVLARWQQPGQSPVRQGNRLCPLGKAMVRFMLPPRIPRREGSLQCASRSLECPREWEMGNLVAIPMGLRRLSEDCRVRRISAGRVLELDELDSGGIWTDSQLHDLDSRRDRPNKTPRMNSTENVHCLDPVPQYASTRTTTTTGFERNQHHSRMAAHPFGATLDGSPDARRIQQALMPPALTQSTSRLSLTTTSSNACSGRPGSPGSMQLSAWRNLKNPGLQTATLMSIQKVGRGPLARSLIPPRRPGAERGADSATMSPSTEQERTAPGPEEMVSIQPMAADENHPPQQQHQPPPDWAMRKTMRKPSHPSPNPNPHEDSRDANTRKSSPTSTRTSTYRAATQPRAPRGSPAPQQQQQDQAGSIARGAARTAFAHHGPPRGTGTWGPVSAAADPGGSSHPQGERRAAKTGVVVAGMGKGSGKGQKGEDKAEEEGKGKVKGAGKENGKGKGKSGEDGKENQKEKGQQAKTDKGDKGSLEYRHWLRSAMVMLTRVVGAYWQVVSPVFDGDSELRKRLDRAQGTGRDTVVCLLAVVFLFLVVSVGVWAVRGIVWMARLLGELWEVLKAVAGL